MTRPLPPWFDDAKLGIFIHWTAAAFPAFATPRSPAFDHSDPEAFAAFWQDMPYAESYQSSMQIDGSPTARHHAEHYGDLPFEAFVEQFKRAIERWDPEPWADLFARAGARYVVLVTRTEDGFLLWPSDHPNPRRKGWQAERDVVGELAAAVRARGMRFGTYYASGLDWTFGGLPVTDMPSLMAAMHQDGEYTAYVEAHWRELIERYHTEVLWNDYTYPLALDAGDLFTHYRSQVPDGVINDRFGWTVEGTRDVASDFDTPEYEQDYSGFGADRKWEACRGIGYSFGYNRQEEAGGHYATPVALVRELVDIVARGGNLLLNVGPTGAGEIPWEQAQRLLAIGWWLHTNGPAIFATRPWTVPAATTPGGLEVRFTATSDAVHAIVFTEHSTAAGSFAVELPVTLQEAATVELLGRFGTLDWESTDSGTRVTLPEAPTGSPAVALRMTPPTAVTR